MQLTRYTDYGLRMLIYLALLPKDEKASIDEISEIYGISRNNVNKIVHQLGKEGIIQTKRGKGGGFHLNVPAKDINLGELIKTLENTLEVVDCQSPPCRIQPVCHLKHILQEATDAFVSTLSKYTLEDIVREKNVSLVKILALDTPSK